MEPAPNLPPSRAGTTQPIPEPGSVDAQNFKGLVREANERVSREDLRRLAGTSLLIVAVLAGVVVVRGYESRPLSGLTPSDRQGFDEIPPPTLDISSDQFSKGFEPLNVEAGRRKSQKPSLDLDSAPAQEAAASTDTRLIWESPTKARGVRFAISGPLEWIREKMDLSRGGPSPGYWVGGMRDTVTGKSAVFGSFKMPCRADGMPFSTRNSAKIEEAGSREIFLQRAWGQVEGVCLGVATICGDRLIEIDPKYRQAAILWAESFREIPAPFGDTVATAVAAAAGVLAVIFFAGIVAVRVLKKKSFQLSRDSTVGAPLAGTGPPGPTR